MISSPIVGTDLEKRFYCFTMANFASPADKPLFTDEKKFIEEFIETLNNHVRWGAKGLKDPERTVVGIKNGDLINCNDERLAPVWEEAGRLKIPVLIHQADPSGFFEPVTPENEHFDSLIKYPS